GKTYDINEELDLKPGRQEFHFQAQARNSPAQKIVLTVEYRPPLPRLVLRPLNEGRDLFEGKDRPEVAVQGRPIPPADPQPFEAVVLVNGKEAQKIARPDKDFSATVPVQPGENLIEVRLSNAWQMTDTVDARITYRRPPRIVKLEKPRVGAIPFVD